MSATFFTLRSTGLPSAPVFVVTSFKAIHYLQVEGAEAPVCLAGWLPVPVDASLLVSGAIIGVMDDAIDHCDEML